jgi:hypothetical protein
MANDATFAGQFDRPSLLLFVGVEIQLPDAGWLRLLDGSGEVTFNGKTFIGDDPTFGVLDTLDAVTDGFGDEAPSLRVGINPKTASAAAILAGQNMQGRPVLVWLGVLDPFTGYPAAPPLLVYWGEVDQGILMVGLGSRKLSMECVSVWERLFDDAEGVRLTNAYHQEVWPGELGFEFVTGVQRQLPWGGDTARPAVVQDALYVRPNA